MTIAVIDDGDTIRVNTEVSAIWTAGTSSGRIAFVNTGNLVAGASVTGRCLNESLKNHWVDTENQFNIPYPMRMFWSESGRFRNNWEMLDDANRKRIALFGWEEYTTDLLTNADTVLKQAWLGLLAGYPADVLDTEVPRYEQVPGTASAFARAGAVVEPIKYFGDLTHGNIDLSANNVVIRARTAQRKFAKTDIFSVYVGKTAVDPILYRLTLKTEADTKATVTDLQIDTNSDGTMDGIYAGITVTGYASAQSFPMSGGSYNFDVVIDADEQLIQRVYEGVHFLLRRPGDIDIGAGTMIGELTDDCMEYVGDTAYTRRIGTKGVYVRGLAAASLTGVGFTDNSGVVRYFAYAAVARIDWGSYAQLDPETKWGIYDEDTWGDGVSTALLDASGNPLTGTVNGATSTYVTWDHTANGDKRCVLIVGGRKRAQIEPIHFVFIQSTQIVINAAPPEETTIP